MHFLEAGTGPLVVFLHGNPTSSYLWRNVLPAVASAGWHCIALDLIGMGGSGKPDSSYRLADHIRYVEAFLEPLGEAVLVGHDWGAVIALDQARRFPERVRGAAFLEGHLHPIRTWADLGDGAELFRRLRTLGAGDALIFDDNMFIETVLPSGMLRTLTREEWDAYRAPFLDPSSRRPMLQWAREIPIEGEPTDVVEVVTANQAVIADPTVPTLLLHGEPGAVIGADEVAWCRSRGRALEIADVGAGTHFLPEDRPEEITAALISWLSSAVGSAVNAGSAGS